MSTARAGHAPKVSVVLSNVGLRCDDLSHQPWMILAIAGFMLVFVATVTCRAAMPRAALTGLALYGLARRPQLPDSAKLMQAPCWVASVAEDSLWPAVCRACHVPFQEIG